MLYEVITTWVSGGTFNNASMIFDHSELSMLFMTDPVYFEKLMTYCLDRSLGYTKAFIDAGADVMLVGGNVPGGFLGAEVYEEFILPWEKKYIDFIQEQGCPAIYHNCGQIMELVDSYKKLGANVIEPFSPVPLGDANLKEAVERVKGDYVVIGGVDQVNLLQNVITSYSIHYTKLYEKINLNFKNKHKDIGALTCKIEGSASFKNGSDKLSIDAASGYTFEIMAGSKPGVAKITVEGERNNFV